MTRRRRLAAVVLVLLSQAASSMVVVCDEGRGRRVVEVLPQLCCDEAAPAGAGRAAVSLESDTCGPCQDTRVVAVLRDDEDDEAASHAAACRVELAPSTCTAHPAAAGRPTPRRAAPETPPDPGRRARLVGTVVLIR